MTMAILLALCVGFALLGFLVNAILNWYSDKFVKIRAQNKDEDAIQLSYALEMAGIFVYAVCAIFGTISFLGLIVAFIVWIVNLIF